MSGAEITSANDDGSFAKANRKQLLADTGTNVWNATKYGIGQLAYSESTSAGLRGDVYYSVDFTLTQWIPLLAKLLYRTNYTSFMAGGTVLDDNLTGYWVNNTTESGTLSVQSLDSSHGRSIRFTTGASAGNQSGFREDLRFTMRKFNPVLRIKFSVQETSNNRFFLGFADTTANLGNTDDPLNAISGIGLGIITTNGNFRILHNDSAGATISVDTTQAIDTNPHEFELFADRENARFWWSLDLGQKSGSISADIPSDTSQQAFQATYTTTTAAARSFQLYQGCIVSTPQV